MGALLTTLRRRSAAAPSNTYAVWSDITVNQVLSNGDLTITQALSGWNSARASQGHIGVDEAFEAQVGGATTWIAGVATADQVLNNYLGIGADGWGVYAAGYSMHNGATADVSSFPVGSWILTEIDRTNGELRQYLVSDGISRTLLKTFDISAAAAVGLFPAAGLFGSSIVANFGQTPLIGPLSAGIREGIYE
jgi:hypothetical protein